MEDAAFEDVNIDGFLGKARCDLKDDLNDVRLAGFWDEVRGEGVKVLSAGRHRVVVADFSGVPVAIKAFGKQNLWKDGYDRRRGSKAQRSFEASCFLSKHGVGTPEPLGYIERWEGHRLKESYFLSAYQPNLRSFRDELIDIYHHRPDCEHYVSLLKHVADALRKMHDAGFYHRDLGNQNIEMAEAKDQSWGEVQFIDLNRGKIRSKLTTAERACDFSRLRLPGSFLEVFCQLYWKGDIPRDFEPQLSRLRRRFYWWEKSRDLRHPFRKKAPPIQPWYPETQDIWIWDRQSAQASIVMSRKERRSHYPRGRNRQVMKALLKSGWGIWKQYQDVLPTAFSKPVKLAGRIGMALEASDLEITGQRGFLDRLPQVPILLRFCHHEGPSQWTESVQDLHKLHEEGQEVMVALVQDRSAVLDPQSWQKFVYFVVRSVGHLVREIEVCHAVNRFKWGVHSAREQRVLLEPVVEVQKEFPSVKFTGPACIDFEYHYVVAALEETPPDLKYSALSHHLYVDRRGAPENFQGKFSTVEKCALLKAIAVQSPQCEDRVVISEVNWPVKGTGIWSPVGATYQSPDEPESPLNVSEEDYGYFMLRYIVLTLCSGFVDQVYWWRLVAHGFGLVDERAEEGWRARPGYEMLVFFLETLGDATFVEKLETEEHVYAMRFERAKDEVTMVWANGIKADIPKGMGQSTRRDVFGELTENEVVSDSPIYFFSERKSSSEEVSSSG